MTPSTLLPHERALIKHISRHDIILASEQNGLGESRQGWGYIITGRFGTEVINRKIRDDCINKSRLWSSSHLHRSLKTTSSFLRNRIQLKGMNQSQA